MANEFRVRKKLIVNGSGSTILDVQGSQGQLFSVTDSLSGSLFSVKDISGIPVMEAFSDDTVNIGTFNAEAIKVSGSFARITGSLFGTASFASNVVSSSYAATASILLGSVTSASYAATASVLLGSVVSSSYADSSSLAISSSYALTSSYALVASSSISSSVAISSSFATNATSASYALTSSYAVNMIISGGLTDVDYIQFDTSSGFTNVAGRLGWENGEGTLQLGLVGGNVTAQLGQDLFQYVYNSVGAPLTKGQVVYISGSQGNRIAVKLASAIAEQGSANTLGIVAEPILTGGQGWVQTEGVMRKLNTAGLIGGQLIYLSSSAGQYTQTKPQAPLHEVRLGYAERIDNTVGSIYIKIDNGYEIDELHNVIIANENFGDLLVNSGSFWINSKQLTGSYGLTGSLDITGSLRLSTPTYNTSSINVLTYNTGSDEVEYSTINDLMFTKNVVTVGLPGSLNVDFNSVKAAIDSITDATSTNTYTVRVYAGLYNEDPIQLKSFVAVVGDSSESTIIQANNPSASLFLGADQSLISDMKIQGVTAPSQSAILYYTSQSVASQGIVYVENVRFGANYTHAKMYPVSGGNAAMQLTNIKYGAQPFTLGFYITSDGISTGRMLLRNVTTTAGGIQSTTDLVFAKTDQPNCTLLANLAGLTKVGSGPAQGTGFWVENGGLLRINTANLQRFATGIYVPQVGSAPTIDAVGLNFENCTTDVNIIHTGSIGKVAGTDNFLKTLIPYEAPLYEVNQDQRRITVAKKGGDFNSISASVAYITDSSETNRYVIDVGPGEFFENQINLRGKPYISIVGSNIQATHIMPSGSGNFDQLLLGPTNEVSFLSLMGYNNPGYAGIVIDGTGDNFAQAHKISIYDFDYGVKVLSTVSSSTFYGEYLDINGAFSYGTYISASNGLPTIASIENYYLFPSGGVSIGNYVIGSGAEIDLYTCLFVGDNVSGSTAVYLVDGAVAEVAGFDAQRWEYGVRVPNIGSAPTFRMVGAMIHDTITHDFFIEKVGTQGRFQGISNHEKINNVSEDFYWNFLDDNDGENDVTRKLSVTFADGTHTDATTLIFKGSSMGVLEGGTITISSSLTVTTAAGYGYLHDPINVEVFKRFDWVNQNITLSPNTDNYIFIDSTGVLSSASTTPNFAQNIILGRVVTNDTGVEFIDQSPWNAEHTANRLSKFNREALGPVFAEGSIVTEDVVPFKLDVTQGNYYFSENNFLPIGTSSINLNQYYISASAWARFTSSIVPNNVYASGSQLVPMSSSYYTKHTVYLVGDGADEEYFLVINGNQYATLVQAEGATLPTIPTYFNDGVVPLAAVYVQSGSANITQIEDIRPVIGFRAAGVNASAVHGNLLGLTADDHLQYLRVDGTRQMSGDLGLGGNDIYNVSSVSASSFIGSLQGTSSWANNAVTSSYAVTASFAPNYVLTSTTSSMTVLSASFATTSSFADNFTVRGTLTAQTIIAQTITSSTDFVTGSTRFGSLLSNTHQFTGSVSITGSLSVNNSGVITSAQTASMSVATASFAFTSSIATSASFASTSSIATSASFATTASYALNSIAPFPYTGSAKITGSLEVTGSISFTNGNINVAANNNIYFTSNDFISKPNGDGFRFLNIGIGVTQASSGNSVLVYDGRATFGSTNTLASAQLIVDSATRGFLLSRMTAAQRTAISAPAQGLQVYDTGSGTEGIWYYDSGSIKNWTRLINDTGSQSISGSLTAIFGFTGSLFGTSSWSQNSISASYVTGSVHGSTNPALSASFAVTASYVLNSVSASYAATAALAPNYVLTSVTGSMLAPYVLSSNTSSFVTNSQTGSFVTNSQTSSFVLNSQTSSFVLNSQTSSFVLNSQTSSMTVATASFATSSLSASYASNGGVTQIVAGTNISISPTNGLGSVTINSNAASSGTGTNTTASFTNSSTWTFSHGLNSTYVVVQTIDASGNQIIPQNIQLTNPNTATITFPTPESGIAIASLGGVGTSAATASYVGSYESAWTSYTPIWTTDGVTQPVLNNGSLTGAYKQIGKTIFVRVKFNPGTTTTFGVGAFQFSLPVTASSPDGIQFPCSILDNGIHWYQGTVNGTFSGTNYKSAIIVPNTSGWADAITATYPFTFGSADSIQFNGTYESI